jgi:hypothetical protein
MSNLNIKTVYYIRGRDPKVIRSKDANRAVAQCVAHMQINHYGSHVAEVYDDVTGELHAQIKRNAKGELHIWYARNPQDFETRFAVSFLLGK